MESFINRWGSAYVQPSFPQVARVEDPTISFLGIPLVLGDSLTVPPLELIVEYESQHYGDKIVLLFKGLTNEDHVVDWLRDFNQGKNRFQL